MLIEGRQEHSPPKAYFSPRPKHLAHQALDHQRVQAEALLLHFFVELVDEEVVVEFHGAAGDVGEELEATSRQDRVSDDLHAGDAGEMSGVLREHRQTRFQGSGGDPGVGCADGIS